MSKTKETKILVQEDESKDKKTKSGQGLDKEKSEGKEKELKENKKSKKLVDEKRVEKFIQNISKMDSKSIREMTEKDVIKTIQEMKDVVKEIETKETQIGTKARLAGSLEFLITNMDKSLYADQKGDSEIKEDKETRELRIAQDEKDMIRIKGHIDEIYKSIFDITKISTKEVDKDLIELTDKFDAELKSLADNLPIRGIENAKPLAKAVDDMNDDIKRGSQIKIVKRVKEEKERKTRKDQKTETKESKSEEKESKKEDEGMDAKDVRMFLRRSLDNQQSLMASLRSEHAAILKSVQQDSAKLKKALEDGSSIAVTRYVTDINEKREQLEKLSGIIIHSEKVIKDQIINIGALEKAVSDSVYDEKQNDKKIRDEIYRVRADEIFHALENNWQRAKDFTESKAITSEIDDKKLREIHDNVKGFAFDSIETKSPQDQKRLCVLEIESKERRLKDLLGEQEKALQSKKSFWDIFYVSSAKKAEIETIENNIKKIKSVQNGTWQEDKKSDSLSKELSGIARDLPNLKSDLDVIEQNIELQTNVSHSLGIYYTQEDKKRKTDSKENKAIKGTDTLIPQFLTPFDYIIENESKRRKEEKKGVQTKSEDFKKEIVDIFKDQLDLSRLVAKGKAKDTQESKISTGLRIALSVNEYIPMPIPFVSGAITTILKVFLYSQTSAQAQSHNRVAEETKEQDLIKIFEKVAERFIASYSHQVEGDNILNHLDQKGMEAIAKTMVGRIISAVGNNEIILEPGKEQENIEKMYLAALRPAKDVEIASEISYQRGNVIDKTTNLDMLKVGIITSDGEVIGHASDPDHKRGLRLGTKQEAIDLSYEKEGMVDSLKTAIGTRRESKAELKESKRPVKINNKSSKPKDASIRDLETNLFSIQNVLSDGAADQKTMENMRKIIGLALTYADQLERDEEKLQPEDRKDAQELLDKNLRDSLEQLLPKNPNLDSITSLTTRIAEDYVRLPIKDKSEKIKTWSGRYEDQITPVNFVIIESLTDKALDKGAKVADVAGSTMDKLNSSGMGISGDLMADTISLAAIGISYFRDKNTLEQLNKSKNKFVREIADQIAIVGDNLKIMAKNVPGTLLEEHISNQTSKILELGQKYSADIEGKNKNNVKEYDNKLKKDLEDVIGSDVIGDTLLTISPFNKVFNSIKKMADSNNKLNAVTKKSSSKDQTNLIEKTLKENKAVRRKSIKPEIVGEFTADLAAERQDKSKDNKGQENQGQSQG